MIMKTQEQIKMSIMGRIYTAYFLRRVFRSSTLRAFLSVGSLAWMFSAVSILHVLKNMPSITNTSALYNFSVTALTKTEITVQLSLALLFVLILWYARDFFRAYTPSQSRLA